MVWHYYEIFLLTWPTATLQKLPNSNVFMHNTDYNIIDICRRTKLRKTPQISPPFFIFIQNSARIQVTLRNVPRTRLSPLIYVVWRGEMTNPPFFFSSAASAKIYRKYTTIVCTHDQKSHWFPNSLLILYTRIFPEDSFSRTQGSNDKKKCNDGFNKNVWDN